MKTLYFLIIFLGTSLSVFAQFPTFYPTYQKQFKVGEDKYSSLPDTKKIFETYKAEAGNQNLVIDPITAQLIYCYYFDLNKILEEDVAKKRIQISRIIPESSNVTQLKTLAGLGKEIADLEEKIANNKILANYFFGISRYYGKPGFWKRILPVTKSSQANFFYNNVSSSGVSTLNSFVVQGTSEKGIVNTETVSGLIGPVRASFTSVFYASSESDSLEVNTKIFNGGGLTNLHFEMPLVYYNHRNFLLYSAIKPGLIADIPIFGTDIPINSFSGYYELPVEFLIEFRTNEGNFSLFANFKGARIAGTKAFYKTLKTTDFLPENQTLNSFWISQVYFGISLSNNFRVTANVPIATTRKIEMPDKIQIGLQILTNSNK
jgi:hypothetical protein